MEPMWWGEHECSMCAKKAYFTVGDSLRCGAHSNTSSFRRELPKNPLVVKMKDGNLDTHNASIEAAAAANRALNKRGTVSVGKYGRGRAMALVAGVRNVFPNNRHQNRVDGFGCASLSPMQLGPVRHGQPGVPDALSIENYYQFNKVFESELAGVTTKGQRDIMGVFYERRNKAYLDPVPHRHKFPPTFKRNGKREVPVFSLHLDSRGGERRCSYLQSRYYYCHQYELLAKQTADFATLRNWLAQGYNLQILGFDGYPITKTMWEHYNDTNKPFGHELALYALLLIENADDYPWNKYYRANRAFYD